MCTDSLLGAFPKLPQRHLYTKATTLRSPCRRQPHGIASQRRIQVAYTRACSRRPTLSRLRTSWCPTFWKPLLGFCEVPARMLIDGTCGTKGRATCLLCMSVLSINLLRSGLAKQTPVKHVASRHGRCVCEAEKDLVRLPIRLSPRQTKRCDIHAAAGTSRRHRHTTRTCSNV